MLFGIQRNYVDIWGDFFDKTLDPNNPEMLDYDETNGCYYTTMSAGTAETKTILVTLWTNGAYTDIFDATDQYEIVVMSEEQYKNLSEGYAYTCTYDFYGHLVDDYIPLSTVVTETDITNEYNIQVTNSNTYISSFNIRDSAERFDIQITDADSTLECYTQKSSTVTGYVDIPSNTTANLKVKFTKKSNVDYTNLIVTEADGSEYVPANIQMNIYEWYDIPASIIGQNKKVYFKSENLIMETLKIGDFVGYTNQVDSSLTNGEYILEAKYSGADTDQTLTSAGGNWRVLNINKQNKTVDLICTIGQNSITLKGAQGYNNGVYLLNDISAKIYGNSTLQATARNVSTTDLIEKLTDTSIIEDFVGIRPTTGDTNNVFGDTYTFSSSLSYPIKWYNHDVNYNYTSILDLFAHNSENGSLIEGDTNDPSIGSQNSDFSYRSDGFSSSISSGLFMVPSNGYSYTGYTNVYAELFYQGEKGNCEDFFMATRCAYRQKEGNVGFGLFKGNWGLGVSTLYNSYSGGSETSHTRAIVTLPVKFINIDANKVDVTITKDNNTTTTTKAWKVESTSLFNDVSSGE